MVGKEEIFPYDEGTCFLVPLNNGLFCRGLVARYSRTAAVFGYFFAPAVSKFTLEDFSNLRASNAAECLKFGDYGLITLRWPIIGAINHWDREEWPLPGFYKECPLTNRIYLVKHSDIDLSFQGETEIQDKNSLISFGTHGYLSVENILNKIFV